MVPIDKSRLNELQLSFYNQLEMLHPTLLECGIAPNSLAVNLEPWRTDERLTLIIPHPTDSEYNLELVVEDEIILFFSIFHIHCENYSDDRTIGEVIESAFEHIKLLLTSTITITVYYKGKREYKRRLDLLTEDGTQKTLENFYVGFSGLLFFLPTKKKMFSVTFKQVNIT